MGSRSYLMRVTMRVQWVCLVAFLRSTTAFLGTNFAHVRSPLSCCSPCSLVTCSSISPMAENKLLHAMIKVPSVERAVEFWEQRGAKVLKGSGQGKGSCFVGYGAYRDATFFALELSPTPTEQEVTSNVVSYFGISMLPPGSTLPSSSNAQPQEGSEAIARSAADRFAAFMEDRKRRTPPAGTMPLSSSEATGIDVRIVPSSPGDTFARIALSVPDPDLTARFYRDVLGMQEVFRSETEVCVRYTPSANVGKKEESWGGLGGPDGGVPTTLVLTLDPAAGGGASNGKVEAFDHLAVGCVSVDAAYAFIATRLSSVAAAGEGTEGSSEAGRIGSKAADPRVLLQPTPMFGTVVCGLTDPDGRKVYLVQEDGFRKPGKGGKT